MQKTIEAILRAFGIETKTKTADAPESGPSQPCQSSRSRTASRLMSENMEVQSYGVVSEKMSEMLKSPRREEAISLALQLVLNYGPIRESAGDTSGSLKFASDPAHVLSREVLALATAMLRSRDWTLTCDDPRYFRLEPSSFPDRGTFPEVIVAIPLSADIVGPLVERSSKRRVKSVAAELVDAYLLALEDGTCIGGERSVHTEVNLDEREDNMLADLLKDSGWAVSREHGTVYELSKYDPEKLVAVRSSSSPRRYRPGRG